MPNPTWTCCADPPPCTGCCGIFDCDSCGVPNNLLIEHSWNDTVYAHGGQVLDPTTVAYSYQTGGTRTIHYSDGTDGCEEGTIVAVSWSEVTVTVNATALIYVGGYQSVCFEWLNATTYQTTAQACGVNNPPDCVPLCEASAGCDGWPNFGIRSPANFYTPVDKYEYTATITITSEDCPPAGNDEWDPIRLSCINDGCAECPRYKIEFNCRTIVNAEYVDPIAYGTFTLTRLVGVNCNPGDSGQWAWKVQPWAYTSDCACTSRPTWKRGYYWAIDPYYPPDYPGPAVDWDFAEAHVYPWRDSNACLSGFVEVCGFLSYFSCMRPGDTLVEKREHEWTWFCSIPGQGEVCPNNDYAYAEITLSGTNVWQMDHTVDVTCQ